MSNSTRPARPQPSSSITPISWAPTRELNLSEWAAAGRRLGVMGHSSQWGLGDWIRYGNAKFGERYARAARITRYDIQTLMNMVYVASRFDISRRRDDLSWSHHETVAALEVGEQDRWLDRAIADRLSVSDLRAELRVSRRRATPDFPGDSDSPPASEPPGYPPGEQMVCPRCGFDMKPASDVPHVSPRIARARPTPPALPQARRPSSSSLLTSAPRGVGRATHQRDAARISAS